jgi:leucine dehydrogenase
VVEIKEILVPGYKKVIEATDKKSKLHGFIAIHDSSLGPALGGTRMFDYASREEALNDVLRLAKGMTYKSALAEDGLGGGKSVIMGPPSYKTEELLLAFAEAVNSLKGEYIAAEDVGTSTEDMVILRKKTPYVSALPVERSSGDPSRFTAWGVYRGIQAVAKTLWHSRSLRHKTILIQGLGHVGAKLADILFWEGANLILSDINEKVLHDLSMIYGAKVVKPEDIFKTPCDIFCPCAMGGSINDQTITQLLCKAVAGSANNQLELPEHGKMLMEKGILYAPDYIINSGGIINVGIEFEPNGYDPAVARDKVNHIYDRLLVLFQKAKAEGKATSEVADQIAEYNLRHGIGKRTQPIVFRAQS